MLSSYTESTAKRVGGSALTEVDYSGLHIDPMAVYRSEESAARIRTSIRKLRMLVKAGRLRPLGYSRCHLFFGRDLLAFLEEEGRGQGRVTPPTPTTSTPATM